MSLDNLAYYKVFVRDLQLKWRGDHHLDLLLMSLEIAVDLPVNLTADRYKFVVCYDRIIKGAKVLAEISENNSLQYLAEQISEHCLEDKRVQSLILSLTPCQNHVPDRNGIELQRSRILENCTKIFKFKLSDSSS